MTKHRLQIRDERGHVAGVDALGTGCRREHVGIFRLDDGHVVGRCEPVILERLDHVLLAELAVNQHVLERRRHPIEREPFAQRGELFTDPRTDLLIG